MRELEQLARFGEDLGATADPEAIRLKLIERLRPVVGRLDVRVTVRGGGRSVVDDRSADDARAEADVSPEGFRGPDAWLSRRETFPMRVGEAFVGQISVGRSGGGRPRPLTVLQRRVLRVAASLAGLSVRNAQLAQQVRERSAVDLLTGCLTKQHGLDLIGAELHRARRSKQPVSLIFVDLDRFKQLNDRYGHPLGDTVLSTVGTAMKDALRGSDLRCRYGGDEFVVLLPETPLDGAMHVAGALRRNLSRQAVPWRGGSVSVTASLGVSTAMPGELDAEALLARADAAMYRAKRDGRDAVRVWRDEWKQSQARCAPDESGTGDPAGGGEQP